MRARTAGDRDPPWRHQELHAGHDDAFPGEGSALARGGRARRHRRRNARRAGGDAWLSRVTRDRPARAAARRCRLPAPDGAAARTWRAPCPTRRSSIRTARTLQMASLRGRPWALDVRLHAVPASDLLSRTGSAVRRPRSAPSRATRSSGASSSCRSPSIPAFDRPPVLKAHAARLRRGPAYLALGHGRRRNGGPVRRAVRPDRRARRRDARRSSSTR